MAAKSSHSNRKENINLLHRSCENNLRITELDLLQIQRLKIRPTAWTMAFFHHCIWPSKLGVLQ